MLLNDDTKINVSNILKDIEKKYSNEIKLLKINGQYVWPVVRYSIRNYLFSKNRIDYEVRLSSKKEKFEIMLNMVFNIFRNVKYKRINYKYTLLECQDRNDQEFGDVYTYSIRKNLKNYNTILRPALKNNGSKRVIENNVYSISFGYVIFLIKSLVVKTFNLYKTNTFIEELCEEYNISNEFIYLDILKFFTFYKYYDSVLKKIKTNKLILYAGYNITNLALVKCANKKGIKTYEIQHGNFTDYDNNYHFHHEYFKEFQAYFCDTFLCFNKGFRDSLREKNSYFHNEKIVEIGFPIVHMLRRIQDVKRTKIKVLVIPTMNLDQNFINLIINLIELMDKHKHIEIAIRFHPNVISERLIKHINEQFKNKVKLDISPWRESIICYNYFIGEYSTTLLEADYIGKKVLLIDTRNARKSDFIMDHPTYIKNISKDTFVEYDWNFNFVIDKIKKTDNFVKEI
ncbi:hypothetical protein [Helicovermis profundi]|uniref:Uncharacterized protein n=1 Tax=Helicovermis profundi TaxID=3065157 RepID=A0AAU9E6L1_9FIRM|nr:hypothetical protein HLPR_26850 [Clostridia bacterium S502]